MNEQYIQRIVEEVVKKLRHSTGQWAPKKSLLVIDEKSSLQLTYLSQLDQHWDVKIVKEEDESLLQAGNTVLLYEINQDLLVKGALGINDSASSRLLAQLIANAVPVYLIPTKVLENVLENKAVPSAYQSMLRAYCERLETFGVRIVSLEKFLQLHDSSKEDSINFHEQLLTAHHVQIHPESHLYLSSKTIITPLAKDTAKELGKQITVIHDVKGENLSCKWEQ